jgi:hypothetical protein
MYIRTMLPGFYHCPGFPLLLDGTKMENWGLYCSFQCPEVWYEMHNITGEENDFDSKLSM